MPTVSKLHVVLSQDTGSSARSTSQVRLLDKPPIHMCISAELSATRLNTRVAVITAKVFGLMRKEGGGREEEWEEVRKEERGEYHVERGEMLPIHTHMYLLRWIVYTYSTYSRKSV